MVIKIQTASSSHGHNAINYAMNKESKDGKKPEILCFGNMEWDNIFGDPIEPRAVWDYMKIRQRNCGREIEEPFFHIELCPSKEEIAGWTMQDWQRLVNDSIRLLDLEYTTKLRGKLKAWDIAHSQWVASLHTDTEKPHIHLIVNRITEENKVQDDTQYKERAKQAANRLAMERGWVKAENIGIKDGTERKQRIHSDAKDVLFSMKHFDLEEYFKLMRLRGWIIDAKYDKRGICRGYSIGEHLYKNDGSLSSTVLLQSSKIGFGRDLTVSRLQATWNKLHPVQTQTVKVEKPLMAEKQEQAAASKKIEAAEQTWQKAEWTCVSYEARKEWNGQGFEARIPTAAYSSIFDAVEEETQGFDKMKYRNPNSEIPDVSEIRAVAIFEFLVAANAVPSVGGGGGGNQSDLRWDGKTKDDFEKMAHGAARKAFGRCTSHLRKRGLHL